MIAGYDEFEFDLPDALLSSLVRFFDQIGAAPLSALNLKEIPEAQGVYMLLLGGSVAYIGKTDSDAGLKPRLERHAWTIQHRQGLDVADITFKAVRIFVFTAMDLETQLIRHYNPAPWNKSGFGSNDPGRNRDHTDLKPEGFDAQFPIDLDREVNVTYSSGSGVADVLNALRKELPYTLRVEAIRKGAKKPHRDIVEAVMRATARFPVTTRKVLEVVVNSLPSGWQATALAGRIILYRENFDYEFGTLIARS